MLAGDCPAELREPLERIQNELFDVGADLCVPLRRSRARLRVEQAQVDAPRGAVRPRSTSDLPELHELRAARGDARPRRGLHVARTVCRRAERETLAAAGEHDVNPLVARLPEPALRSPLHPRARGERARRRRRAALEAGSVAASGRARPVAGEVFRVALRLGLTSFGGPVAHIGYFRDEYVVRRRWLDEAQFGELVALSTLLPGPSSSQLGIAIGVHRAGKLGGLAAWLGFTLPSAAVLTAFALSSAPRT